MGQPLQVILGPDQAGSLLDPVRVRLLQELAEPDSAAGLARKLGLTRQKVNYHLRNLEREKLVEFVETRRKRNCFERIVRATATHYVIDPAVLGKLAARPEDVQEKLSASYLIAVAAQIIRELAVLKERAAAADQKLPTLTAQTDVRFKCAEDQLAYTQELTDTMARLAARYHDEKASNGRTFRFVMASYPAITKSGEDDVTTAGRRKTRTGRGKTDSKGKDGSDDTK